MAGNKEEFAKELKEFIENNKNNKITNSVVDRKLYDKIYERFVAGKRTNVKAITSVYKLCQYYLTSLMLDDKKLQLEIEDLIISIVNGDDLLNFKDMFSEVDYETPDVKNCKMLKIRFENGKFYVFDGITEHEAFMRDGINQVKHFLTPYIIEYDRNCWEEIDYLCLAAPGSINISVPWNIKAIVKFNKNTGKYFLEDIEFYAEYNIKGLSLVARYSGPGRSAWINKTSLYSFVGRTTIIENKKWEGSPIARGRAYICINNEAIASVKSDWNGHSHTLTFDQLRELLEKAAV